MYYAEFGGISNSNTLFTVFKVIVSNIMIF